MCNILLSHSLSEGFPRSDVDVYRVVAQRKRLSTINFDHKDVMKNIETCLQQYQVHYSNDVALKGLSNNSSSTTAAQMPVSVFNQLAVSSTVTDSSATASLSPMAVVDEILADSPASLASLVDGDWLLSFGSVSRDGNGLAGESELLSCIPGVVKNNVNKPIPLVISRVVKSTEDGRESSSRQIMNITIVPKSWGGRGLLGCHLTPFKDENVSN